MQYGFTTVTSDGSNAAPNAGLGAASRALSFIAVSFVVLIIAVPVMGSKDAKRAPSRAAWLSWSSALKIRLKSIIPIIIAKRSGITKAISTAAAPRSK